MRLMPRASEWLVARAIWGLAPCWITAGVALGIASNRPSSVDTFLIGFGLFFALAAIPGIIVARVGPRGLVPAPAGVSEQPSGTTWRQSWKALLLPAGLGVAGFAFSPYVAIWVAAIWAGGLVGSLVLVLGYQRSEKEHRAHLLTHPGSSVTPLRPQHLYLLHDTEAPTTHEDL
jgi:hypothetical protein